MMLKPIYIIAAVLFFLNLSLVAQPGPEIFASQTTEKNRTKEFRNLVNSINQNLSPDLSDSTEDNWQSAFYALELIQYKSPWVDKRIHAVFDSLEKRSIPFQRAFLELIYTNYQKAFVDQVYSFANKTLNTKLLAMCIEYILISNPKAELKKLLEKRIKPIEFFTNADNQDPFLNSIKHKLAKADEKRPPLSDLLNTGFLQNEIVLFSFQRKNRNYPGLVIVRDRNGVFIKDEYGNYFSVPQLARSNSNMAGYLTNGNTPQGIFKMTGFGISNSSFIGPTTNIQMILPYENTAGIPDSLAADFGFNYSKLLPGSWRNYFPIYESYYAGLAGRTEIIAHGTTVNPEYYKGQSYYPLTPTQGCLCTKEIWSTADGKRMESDQQKLINALIAAGGANGYCVVVEIDDQQKPVSIHDILPYLKPENK